MAESCRSSLVYNAKCMGLFRKGADGSESEQRQRSPEGSWHAWIRAERLRRIAWTIFVGKDLTLFNYSANRVAGA